jgi:hypothetical protein
MRMADGRSTGCVLGLLGLFVGSVLPDSWFAVGLRYVALGYIWIDILMRVRAGYLRRHRYWTRDSWRRYLRACAVPAGALVIMAFMMAAIEWRLPLAGPGGSTARGFWAAGILVFMAIGAFGLGSAIDWLNQDDPAWQCDARHRAPMAGSSASRSTNGPLG